MTPTMVHAVDKDEQGVLEAMQDLVDAGFAIWSVSDAGGRLLILESGEGFELRPKDVRRTR
jgi:hypothetical protein